MSFTDVVTVVGLKSTDSYNTTNLINSERIKKKLNKAVRKYWGNRDHYFVPYIKDITKLIISINGDDPSLC